MALAFYFTYELGEPFFKFVCSLIPLSVFFHFLQNIMTSVSPIFKENTLEKMAFNFVQLKERFLFKGKVIKKDWKKLIGCAVCKKN